MIGGCVMDGLEDPVHHLLLPGVRGALRVVVDDHRVFALPGPRSLLLPPADIGRDDEGHDGASDADGIGPDHLVASFSAKFSNMA